MSRTPTLLNQAGQGLALRKTALHCAQKLTPLMRQQPMVKKF